MRLLMLCVALCCSSSGYGFQVVEKDVVLHGHVINNQGNPVVGALVAYFNIGHGSAGPIPVLRTDSAGAFVSPPLPDSIYNVVAWKDAEGVPTPTWAINEPLGYKATRVDTRTMDSSADIVLRLPEPFGMVHLTVVDSETGNAVANARISLRREGPEIYFTKGVREGKFSALLPNRPIRISIIAPGYKEWTYIADDGSPFLTLPSRYEKLITVSLSQ